MSISNLPSDLVKEIISKIPLRYVKAVRLTCKEWNTIICEIISKIPLSLTKLAIGEAAKDGESHMITLMNNNLSLMKISANGDPSAETKGKLICLNNTDDQIKISAVFHCKGLLLCNLKEDSRLVVWNPYWGQARWIVPRFYHSPRGHDMYNYALGYENKKSKSCSFKLFRFMDYYYVKPPKKKIFWYEIYDLDSGLWTTLDVTPHWKIRCSSRGVSLKGNTYWIAGKRDSCDQVFDHIICFDFTSERFGQLLRLPFTVGQSPNVVTLSCVREEKLAVLFFHSEPWEIEIWMSTKIQTKKVWWSKFLSLEVTNSHWINHHPDAGSFFIDEVQKVAMIFEKWYGRYRVIIIGEAGYVREIDIGDRIEASWPLVCPYVPSLVQIKQPTRCRRKRQNSLESRLYERNMVKLVALEKKYP